MNSEDIKKLPDIPKWFYWVFAGVLLIFLYNVIDVATPFITAAIIAWFLNIYVEFFEKLGLKRKLAVFISLLSCAILITTAVIFIIPPLVKQIVQINKSVKYQLTEIHKAGMAYESKQTSASLNSGNIDNIKNLVSTFLKGVYETYPIVKLNQYDENKLISFVESKQQEIITFVISFINDAVLNVSGFISRLFNLVLIPIFTCYFLAIIPNIKLRIRYLLDKNAYGSQIKTLINDIGDILDKYIRGTIFVMFLFGLAVGIGIYITSFFTGIKYSLFIGCLAGLLCIVPYVGLALIAITTAIIAWLTTGGSFSAVLISLLVLFVINFVFDNYLSPKIVGTTIGLHPLLSMFAMLSVGKLFGFWGLVFAVPCAAIVKIIMIKLYPVLFEPINLKNDEQNKKAQEKQKNACAVRIPIAHPNSESPFTIREALSEKEGPKQTNLPSFKSISKSLLPTRKRNKKQDERQLKIGRNTARKQPKVRSCLKSQQPEIKAQEQTEKTGNTVKQKINKAEKRPEENKKPT